MGKEWYWVGKSSKKGVIVEQGAKTTTSTTTPSGCMCAVFQLFDFHPFQFPTTLNNQQQENSFKSLSCISQDQINKGVVAPRNSLESEDGTFSSLSKEDDFKMPKNIQIKTKRSNVGNLNDFSSEINSPGTKTPTLVARLMGLELLPNENSPTFSSCLSTPNSQGKNIIQNFHQVRTKQHIQTKHRNSIDSSEISSTRKSDVDYYHHRFSLQINKENLCEDLELPRFSFSKKKIHDENNSSNKSSSHYARQIVKQVKESVTRKVGQDITNNNLKNKEFVEQSRIKKSSKTSLKPFDEFSSEGKHSNSSFSPRIRFIENKQKPNTATTTTTSKELNTPPNFVKAPPPQPKLPRVLTKPKGQESRDKKSVSTKCKKSTNEKFSSRFSSRFHSPKSSSRANDIKSNTKSKKSTQPLSSNLLNNINAVVKTDPFVQKQVSDPQNSKFCSHLSNCSSERYKNEVTTTLFIQETITNFTQDKFNGSSIIETHKPEFQYITEILNKQGTTTTTTKTVSFNKWFSPTHPLDPSIFHHLEHNPKDKVRNFTTKNELGHRWNRKLLFDLVDEVLIEILKPNGSEKKLSFLHSFCNEWPIMELTERVWKRIGEFPCAKCEVLDDIDNLIEAEDMEKLIKVEGEEEGEGLVEEIEGKILDMLMHETVMVIGRNELSF